MAAFIHHPLIAAEVVVFCLFLDKIDIFRVQCFESCDVLYGCSSKVLYHDYISDVILQTFMKKQAILSSLRKTHLDILVSHLALLFDVHYTCSFALILEQGYYEQLLSSHSFKNTDTQERYLMIKAMAYDYLKTRAENYAVPSL